MTERSSLVLPNRHTPAVVHTDVLLVGGGIMSATLGTLVKSLEPDWSISLFERLGGPARESSDPWNNAGTGHSALCELNYTPQRADGSVDVSKAITVNQQFQLSRQFWAHGVSQGVLGDPATFINPVPHVSFVRGADDAAYLKARHEALVDNPLFAGIEYVDDRDEIARRLPLMSAGRDDDETMALNWSDGGTDVDFGSVTRQLLGHLESHGAELNYEHEVRNLKQNSDSTWTVTVKDLRTGQKTRVNARFVFVGAGGGALHLLQKSGIPEIRGFGGFPVSGQFLRTTNADLAKGHHAKVYGKPPVGAPPMSVPHLDTRVVDGQHSLMFGPYAGFSPRFLKEGHLTDLVRSVKPNNLFSMLGVGLNSMPLTVYLVKELLKSREQRVEGLLEFAPSIDGDDFELITAGQRVQTIRRNGMSGTLEFGTCTVSHRDGTIAGLLGASPGASTAVAAMVDVLETCFPDRIAAWRPRLVDMMPSYGTDLMQDTTLLADLRRWSDKTLRLVGDDHIEA
ncbi:malate dehydrogenase (quinone) [Aeromicrobium endophyticum]|nr:malate dehydrogenase (quinone) [Aeromicrobium endophyticum]